MDEIKLELDPKGNGGFNYYLDGQKEGSMIINILIILLAFLAAFVFIWRMYFEPEWNAFWGKLRKPSPIKLSPVAIDPPFETIKEVFDKKLMPPPVGCLWEIEKLNNIHMNKEVYARIKLLTPSGIYRIHQDIPLPKGNAGLIDLAKKVNYASKRIVNEYSIEHGDWDGVYMKDVL